MSKLYFKIAALFALAVLVLVAAASTEVRAQTPAADPAATRILQRMTEYLGSLGQFSAHTQNTLEDMLDSGHRVDYDGHERLERSAGCGRCPVHLRAAPGG